MRARSFSTVLLTLAAACGSEDPADRSFTVRDSAGIAIVENLEPEWHEGEGWTLSPEPIRDIGVVEGDPAYQLNGVRDAARGPEGTILVTNGGTEEIRVYGPSGTFLRSIGREGDGPGEFRSLAAVEPRAGDTVVAFDIYHRRVTSFGPSGEISSSSAFAVGDGRPTGPMSFGDGSFLLGWRQSEQNEAASAPPPGQPYRVPTVLVHHGRDGSVLDTVGTFPSVERALVEMPTGGQIAVQVPFGPTLHYAIRAGEVFVGTADRYEVRVYAQGGSVLRILRWVGADRSVPEATAEEFVRRMIQDERDPNTQRLVEQVYSALPLPAERAAYLSFLVDSEGNLWVRSFPAILEMDESPTYDVFSPEGRWRGETVVPDGLRVFEVGEDYVLGLATDELDVEHVQIYGLER